MSQEQETTQMKKLLPKIDVVFQALFGEVGNEKITQNFLESILKEPINDIDLSQNIVMRREHIDDKLGVLDVFAKINGVENCNIEMQIGNQYNIIERILLYWSRIYSKQIKKGNDYKELNRAICILITDFGLDEIKKLEPNNSIFINATNDLEELSYHTKWLITEKNARNVVLTNLLEIHIISLEELRRKPVKSEEDGVLLDWLEFLEDPESRRLVKKMEENEALQEAEEKLCSLSENEYMQRLAELRQKEIMDRKAIRRAGEIEGREEGLKEGIEKGEKEGERKAKLETAKKLIEKGMDIETVAEITGLSKEKILKLNN